MTRKEILLWKAKKMFPIGQNFISLFGARDVVEAKAGYIGKTARDIWYITKNNEEIYVNCRYDERMIYDRGKWADRIRKNGSIDKSVIKMPRKKKKVKEEIKKDNREEILVI